MTIAKLQQFLAVCQFQSVSRAAEFLHISQPSVSGTIRDLESEFQINLFRHEGRRLVLTAEGSFLRERAQKLIRQFDELSWQMEDLGNQKNRFRIGIPPMAGTVFFPQLYKAFQAAYPEITLSDYGMRFPPCGKASGAGRAGSGHGHAPGGSFSGIFLSKACADTAGALRQSFPSPGPGRKQSM